MKLSQSAALVSFWREHSGGRIPRAFEASRTEALDWTKVRLYLGDERWVPATDDLSNGRMARETLLEGLGAQRPQFFPVDTALSSVEEGAKELCEDQSWRRRTAAVMPALVCRL